MKIIELGHSQPTLDEVIGQADEGPLVLRKPDGSVFLLSPVDDFAVEVELLKDRPDFLAYLKELSRDQPTISLQDLRNELDL